MRQHIINKFTAAAIIAAVSLSGCTKKDFGDVNSNPYITSVPVTTNLLTGALRSLPSTTNDATGSLYAQFISDVQYTDGGRFLPINFDYAGLYRGPILSTQKIIEINTNPETSVGAQLNGSNANQIATARILKAYFFFKITNRWGDVPYFDAVKQGENLVPKFDRQEDIIADLFKELKEASAQFDGGAPVKGDIFLSGNIARWKQFASSLRLIMALRLSKADPAKGKTEFLSAKADGVVTTNANSFRYAHLSETANQSEWYARYLTRFDYAISVPFLTYLQGVNDPRIPVYADKPTNGNANYVGMPYGLAVTSGIANNSVSYIGSTLRKQNSPEVILSAAHVLFTLAEGEKLGWNTAGVANDAEAETYYNEGIKVSMEQFNVYTPGAYATYIAQPAVAYTPADAIKKISEQRWTALYLNGYEAWAEWRRTGYPALTPGPSPLSIGGQIPRRQAYPISERDLNLANYNAVVADQGPDAVATRMYIDKP
jgi:SusD/RagB-like outer membrane lipoprotein